ncbi:hypothetical protein [Flavobacterium covae]|uniref:hypothetical protein n=1 Tax=Flavobacterium covae TaxID=2906076 RepID=UPI000745C4B7|nr:hypothetical protein [Flavobacterium covae]AMA48090.1 hypothetical protein AWN65_00745 [Flavobacterium covae]MCJ1808889.1 hypothetical protein [Flavobacterium covae]
MTADVQIRRVHKRSPFNVKHYIPDVAGTNEKQIFESAKIQNLINETFGNKLIVSIIPIGIGGQTDFIVTKNKARCNN